MADAGWTAVGPALLLMCGCLVGRGRRLGEYRVIGIYGVLALFLWWLGVSRGR